jgi:hypothetical protein
MNSQPNRAVRPHHQKGGPLSLSPIPSPSWLLSHDTTIWQIKELKRFWDQPETKAREKSLWASVHQLAQGFHFPFGLVVRHQNGSVFAGWLTNADSFIQGPVEASFPGIVLTSIQGGGPALLQGMPRFAAALVVSGHPANEPDKTPPGLDLLIQGLPDCNWLYLSLALPLSGSEQSAQLQQAYAREKELKARYLRPGTALEKNNPMAETALEEIQATRIKLEQGLRTGLWKSSTVLYLDRKEAVSPGLAQLKTLFAGKDARPGSLKIQLCVAEASRATGGSGLPFTMLSSGDLARFMHIPAREYQGYPVKDFSEFDTHIEHSGKGQDLFLGKLKTPPFSPVTLALQELNKHLLIAGSTGSGKTSTCLFLLCQAWQMHGIPFLVLETSEKTEYGPKLQHIMGNDLTLFSLGNEQKNPLHLDILRVPEGRHIEAHLGHLMRIFKAAFPLPPPTPYILEEGLRIWYTRSGWDLEKGRRSSQAPGLIFHDLIEIVADLLNTKYAHYDPQTRGNIESALLVRLETLSRGGMGGLLAGRSDHETQWETLLQRPVVMDLSTFTDPDNKALAVLFLLYRLMSSAHSAFAENPGRIHLTVVEEAHRVLNDRQASQHPDVADTRAAMVEEFANALSEVRYAGEGLIILDQMPSRLSPAVLANTNMKLAHRLPTGEEQQCLSKAAGLTDGQQNLLYRLKPGEALWLSPDGSTYHIQVPFFDK